MPALLAAEKLAQASAPARPRVEDSEASLRQWAKEQVGPCSPTHSLHVPVQLPRRPTKHSFPLLTLQRLKVFSTTLLSFLRLARRLKGPSQLSAHVMETVLCECAA